MEHTNILRIAVIEDDEFFAGTLKYQLQTLDHVEITIYPTGTEFLTDGASLHPNVCVIDYDLPDMNGLTLLEKIHQENKDTVCIILSGQKEMNVVVDAYKKGAERYIVKDEHALVELKQQIARQLENFQTKRALESLRNQLIEKNRYENIIGSSAAMTELFNLMSKVENVRIPILITGSNGTGKELVAQALHYNSDRKRCPFVAINVAAIPEDLIESELFGSEKGAFTGAIKRIGKFEEANGGTLFLDEIAEMPLHLQAKLLRVLQQNELTRLGGNRPVALNIKILSATNKDLWREVQAGRFREDLFFRLQGFILNVPDLRRRENDVVLLAKHYIDQFCRQSNIPVKQLGTEAVRLMLQYDWPGNVRELKSMVERACLVADGNQITETDLIFLNLQRA